MTASKEPKKYSILPKSSILLDAESIGIDDLSDEVIEVVCQDVNYRLREVLQKSIDQMIRCKRLCLNTSDVNNSLQALGHQPILGQSDMSEGSLEYNLLANDHVYVNDDKKLDLFEIADTSINLEYMKRIDKKSLEILKDSRGIIEERLMEGGIENMEVDNVKDTYEHPFGFTRCWLKLDNKSKPKEVVSQKCINKELVLETIKAFLHDDVSIYKMAYKHLNAYQGINNVLGLFYNSIPKVLSQTSTPLKRRRVYHMLHAIITNPHAQLNYTLVLNKIVNIIVGSVQKEPKNAKHKVPPLAIEDLDEIIFIFNIAHTFIRKWSSLEHNLEKMILNKLKDIVTKITIHPYTLACTILAYDCFGVKAIVTHLLPLLLPIIDRVQKTHTQTSSHISTNNCHEAVFTGCDMLSHVSIMTLRLLVKWEMEEKGNEDDCNIIENIKLISKLYDKLMQLFGDKVVSMIPTMDIGFAHKNHIDVKLTDKDSFKTGEELIEEMMMEEEEMKEKADKNASQGMSVKTTFSEAHIKLTIAKKVNKHQDQVKSGKVQSSHRASLEDAFEISPLKRTDEALITFKFKGKNFLSTFLEKRKAMLLARNIARQHASVSRYRQLCSSLPLHGKIPSRSL